MFRSFGVQGFGMLGSAVCCLKDAGDNIPTGPTTNIYIYI